MFGRENKITRNSLENFVIIISPHWEWDWWHM